MYSAIVSLLKSPFSLLRHSFEDSVLSFKIVFFTFKSNYEINYIEESCKNRFSIFGSLKLFITAILKSISYIVFYVVLVLFLFNAFYGVYSSFLGIWLLISSFSIYSLKNSFIKKIDSLLVFKNKKLPRQLSFDFDDRFVDIDSESFMKDAKSSLEDAVNYQKFIDSIPDPSDYFIAAYNNEEYKMPLLITSIAKAIKSYGFMNSSYVFAPALLSLGKAARFIYDDVEDKQKRLEFAIKLVVDMFSIELSADALGRYKDQFNDKEACFIEKTIYSIRDLSRGWLACLVDDNLNADFLDRLYVISRSDNPEADKKDSFLELIKEFFDKYPVQVVAALLHNAISVHKNCFITDLFNYEFINGPKYGPMLKEIKKYLA